MPDMQNYGIENDIKSCLLEDILSDSEAVRLIEHKKEIKLPAKHLLYDQVVPWCKVPDTAEEAKTFVTCEVTIPRAINDATRIYRLHVFAIVHQSQMKIDSANASLLGLQQCGSKLDILLDHIDYLISGSKRYTFDELKFVGQDLITVPQNFFGKVNRYEIRGWNMAGEKIREGEMRGRVV